MRQAENQPQATARVGSSLVCRETGRDFRITKCLSRRDQGKLTFVAPREAERRDGSDYAEYIVCHHGLDLALSRVGLKEREAGTRRGYDLLFFCPRELAQQRLRDVGRRLDRKRIHEHIGSGRHLVGGTQHACAALNCLD